MSTDPLIGKKLGDYIIVDTLGHGGMARVYRGIDKKLNRYAAVKVIDAHLISDHEQDEYRQRFQNEARAIARLNHPNIVGIYQFDQVGTVYYMAMSFIEGKDLRSILRDYAKSNTFMPYSQVLKIIQDIGSALDYAHKEGVIHRDIKPSNIMVTPSGRAVLTDFGLALSVSEGTVGNTFGSAHYIAPEQAVSSAQAVPQSDIYSLGVVLFEMLTSRVPFQDQNAMAVAMKHLNDPPPSPSRFNPNILPKVDQMVLRALNKTPSKRYNTGTAMAQALESALGAGAISDENVAVQGLPSWTGNSPSSPSRPSIGSTGTRDTVIFNGPEGTRPRPPLDDLPTVTDSRKSQATRAAIAQQQAAQARRMRLLAVGGVVLIVGALILMLAALNGGSGADIGATETADAVALVGTQTADALALITEEPTATETLTEESTPEATPSEEPTDEPTETSVVTTTELPTDTPAPTDTTAPSASDTPTDEPTTEPTDTAAPADTNTPEPTPTTEEAPVSLVGNAEEAPVLLVYDDISMALLNQSGDNVDASGLTFVQVDSTGREIDFETRLWNGGSRPTTSLPNGTCFQVYKNTVGDVAAPDVCRARHAFRTVASPRWFWISTDPAATFEVRRDGEVLATCEVAAGECALDLSAS